MGQSTPFPWLSVLANIKPPDIGRQIHLGRDSNKIDDITDLPIHDDIDERIGPD